MTVKMMKGDRCYNINDSAEDIARAKSMGMVLVDEPKAEEKPNAETTQTEQTQETQAEAKQDKHTEPAAQEPVAEKHTRRAKKEAQ